LEVIIILKAFISSLKNRWMALSVSVLIFILAFFINRNTWVYLFAILLSYMIAHVLSSFICIGGGGIVQFPFTGSTETRNMGHGYLVYLSSIIGGTILSSIFADTAIKYINNNNALDAIIISNVVLGISVFIDFHVTFYSRK
jgi:hypothetical protein